MEKVSSEQRVKTIKETVKAENEKLAKMNKRTMNI